MIGSSALLFFLQNYSCSVSLFRLFRFSSVTYRQWFGRGSNGHFNRCDIAITRVLPSALFEMDTRVSESCKNGEQRTGSERTVQLNGRACFAALFCLAETIEMLLQFKLLQYSGAFLLHFHFLSLSLPCVRN